MKTQYLMLLMAFLFISVFAFSQTKTDTIKVYGNCGSCKDRIEKAAKEAGATNADWNDETELLIVSYDSTKTTNINIQQKIAAVGHDTQDVKAPDNVYNDLEKCCQYKRKAATKPSAVSTSINTNNACCKDKELCTKMNDCCKSTGMSCCSKDAMAKNTCCADKNCGKS